MPVTILLLMKLHIRFCFFAFSLFLNSNIRFFICFVFEVTFKNVLFFYQNPVDDESVIAQIIIISIKIRTAIIIETVTSTGASTRKADIILLMWFFNPRLRWFIILYLFIYLFFFSFLFCMIIIKTP